MKKLFLNGSFLVMAIVFFYMLFSQCYTTFQHPTVYVPVDSTTYYEQEVTFADDCSQCHSDEKSKIENQNDIYAEPLYQQNYMWNYYFVTPWWYDPYYYSGTTPATAEDDNLPPTQRRDFDRRNTSPMPSYGAPAPSSPTLSKPRSGSSRRSASAPQQKRNERRQSVSPPTKKSHPSTPAPQRVPRKETKKKKK